ncbi:MAG: phytoene desaturase [Saprospiraceae bacterium]|nr:phytoene desaturase [Saprospiraceae bacterium]
MSLKTAVIGSGFSGISAAAYLAAAGHEVTVFEKNSLPGGRARQFDTEEGYRFDMGPSWYWMPDVFERFFNDFGYSASDFYKLTSLDPAFDVLFGTDDGLSVPADFGELCQLFESIEPGSAAKLKKFMHEAEFKYKTGMESLVYKPGLSLLEFADWSLMKGAVRLQVFSSFSKHVRKYFTNPKLIALMEFPVLFLGATPQNTPALYSLMNYAGLKLGTWYPEGGFGKVIEAMKSVAEKNGAVFQHNAAVEKIELENGTVRSLLVNGQQIACDAVVASADYHHVENLLPDSHRNYSEDYWEKKVFAPSCLIYYLGVSKKLDRLKHHTLFFDENLDQHAYEIYSNPQWPTKPLFYVCCPSKSDDTVAPAGHENLFLLMPLAPGLQDTPELRETYFLMMITRLEKQVQTPILGHIDYKRSYCINDFVIDYNAYKGNAYGLANTLMQTAILKPKIKNKHINNLFYAGQLTVPGPGVPPSIISGKVAATQLLNKIKKHEVLI